MSHGPDRQWPADIALGLASRAASPPAGRSNQSGDERRAIATHRSHRLEERPTALSSGLRFAAVAAVLSWTFTTLAVAAKHSMTSVSRFVLIETAFTAVQFLLVGPLLAVSGRAAAPAPRETAMRFT